MKQRLRFLFSVFLVLAGSYVLLAFQGVCAAEAYVLPDTGVVGSGTPQESSSFQDPEKCTAPSFSPSDFQEVLEQAKSRSFESARLSYVIEVIQKNCLLVEQLDQLLQLFTFDNTRVEIARFAYSHLVDPENFEKLYQRFTLDASIEQLEQHVEQQKQRNR